MKRREAASAATSSMSLMCVSERDERPAMQADLRCAVDYGLNVAAVKERRSPDEHGPLDR
jgi:hypothetical protein